MYLPRNTKWMLYFWNTYFVNTSYGQIKYQMHCIRKSPIKNKNKPKFCKNKVIKLEKKITLLEITAYSYTGFSLRSVKTT